MTESLSSKHCVPCHGGEPLATDAEKDSFGEQIPKWSITTVDGEERLVREYTFPDFAAALAFTNRVGAIAEAEGHHPALLTEWGKVTVSWWTHAIGGLHENDFIMASKTDELYSTPA
jgi:4a-hydroxytetrahydrobiopterin dehydratase